jgi:hypothetical protein
VLDQAFIQVFRWIIYICTGLAWLSAAMAALMIHNKPAAAKSTA